MAEVYTGEVRGGVVVFDPGAAPLPEGTKVQMQPIVASGGDDGGSQPAEDPVARTRAWLLRMAAEAEALAPDLPADLAENHDHYAHGKPRT